MSLGSKTIIFGIATAVPQLVNFAVLPLLANRLSTSEFGTVNVVTSLAPVAIVLMTLMLDRSISRLYFDFQAGEDRKTLLGTVVLGIWAISVLGLALYFGGRALLRP